ncbi:hypothetical protein AB0A76_36215, partial [Streptomyces exfoliatus]
MRPRPSLFQSLKVPVSALGGAASLAQGNLGALHGRTALRRRRLPLALRLPGLPQLVLQAMDPLGSLLGLRRHSHLSFPGLAERLLSPGDLGVGVLRRRTSALQIAQPPRRLT